MKLRSLPGAILLGLFLAAGVLVAHDSRVPVHRQLSTRSAVAAIGQYRAHISPHLRGRIQCRFTPTCSASGLEAVKKYGGFRGSWRAVKRIARCNGLTPLGTVDLP